MTYQVVNPANRDYQDFVNSVPILTEGFATVWSAINNQPLLESEIGVPGNEPATPDDQPLTGTSKALIAGGVVAAAVAAILFVGK